MIYRFGWFYKKSLLFFTYILQLLIVFPPPLFCMCALYMSVLHANTYKFTQRSHCSISFFNIFTVYFYIILFFTPNILFRICFHGGFRGKSEMCVCIFENINKGKGKGRLWVLQHCCLEAYCTLTRMISFIHRQRRCTHHAA